MRNRNEEPSTLPLCVDEKGSRKYTSVPPITGSSATAAAFAIG